MSKIEIKEEDVRIVNAHKLSENKKDSFNYSLRKSDNGWIIYYDHYNVDEGLVKSDKYYIPDELVDVITTYHAKEKLNE